MTLIKKPVKGMKDILNGFDLGSKDYVTKPFSMKMLLWCIKFTDDTDINLLFSFIIFGWSPYRRSAVFLRHPSPV